MLVDIQVCRVDKPRICRWVNGKEVARPRGAAVIRLEDRSAADDVITVPTGARATLSLCALGGMGYEVNPKTGRLKKLDAALLL